MEALSWRKSAVCLLFSFSFLAQSQSVPHRDRETLRSTSRCPIYHFELTPFYSHRANTSHSIIAPPPPTKMKGGCDIQSRTLKSFISSSSLYRRFIPVLLRCFVRTAHTVMHGPSHPTRMGVRGVGRGGVLFIKLDVSFPVFECKYWNLLPSLFFLHLKEYLYIFQLKGPGAL